MPDTDLQERSFGFLPRVASIAILVTAGVSVGTLIGWIVGINFLAELVPNAPRMAGNTAIALLLLCGSLWMIRDPAVSPRTVRWARLPATLAVLIGVLTLFEYITGVEVGVDDLFVDDGLSGYPGHMSPHVAAILVCLGLWLITIDFRFPASRIPNTLAPVAGLGVLSALIGWLYGVDYVQNEAGQPGIAPQAVTALVAFFVALLAARPLSPWMLLVTGPGSGGHLMRRFVPLLILGTVIAGDLLMRGVLSDLWSVEVGSAFMVAALVTALLAGLVQISRQLEWADVERRRLEASLVDLAARDPLTNVFNRRRFDDDLARQFALYQRHGTPVAILSIDLDDFKAINDTHGHAAGDELLLATAAVLDEQLRQTDIVARFGGDEFVVMLPEIEEAAAAAVAEKLVEAFHRVVRRAPDGSALTLRASVGVAHSARVPWQEPEALLRAADNALYVAKRQGGDTFATDAPLIVN